MLKGISPHECLECHVTGKARGAVRAQNVRICVFTYKRARRYETGESVLWFD